MRVSFNFLLKVVRLDLRLTLTDYEIDSFFMMKQTKKLQLMRQIKLVVPVRVIVTCQKDYSCTVLRCLRAAKLSKLRK